MTRHYAPTYRLAIYRPDGQPYRVEGGLPSPEAVEQVANRERGAIRAERGWTPRFRAFYAGQDGDREVTHLVKLF